MSVLIGVFFVSAVVVASRIGYVIGESNEHFNKMKKFYEKRKNN